MSEPIYVMLIVANCIHRSEYGNKNNQSDGDDDDNHNYDDYDDDDNDFSNFNLLLDTLNVTNTSLTKKVTCTWLAYND